MTVKHRIIEEAVGVAAHAAKEWITDFFERRTAKREEAKQRDVAVKELPQ